LAVLATYRADVPISQSIEGAGHVDLPEIAGAEYRERLRAFLEQVLSEPR
jgi:hypothetical protein